MSFYESLHSYIQETVTLYHNRTYSIFTLSSLMHACEPPDYPREDKLETLDCLGSCCSLKLDVMFFCLKQQILLTLFLLRGTALID